MALTNMFAEVTKKQATKQTALVDQVLEESPVLNSMPMMEASHDLHNVYEDLISVTGGSVMDLDGVFTKADSVTGLNQTAITKIGGLLEVGMDKAGAMGGKAAYFASLMPRIAKATFASVEKSILYDNIRATAIAGSKVQDAGGVANANYSILCVKYAEGQNIGLSGKNAFAGGKMFQTANLSGGDLMDITDANNNIIPGYKSLFYMYFGLQLASLRNISGIVNVDIINDKFPTEDQLSQCVEDARAIENAALYMHPSVKRVIGSKYKLDKVRLSNTDREVNSLVDGWDGVPIIASYNFDKGTEGNVTV